MLTQCKKSTGFGYRDPGAVRWQMHGRS
jgi:hypothetical protein